MTKAILILALVSSSLFLASAQSLQNLADQINAAAGNVGNGAVQASQDGDSLNLLVGEYDWILSENNEGNLNLEVVNTGNANSQDLAAALNGLLGGVGNGVQDNSNAVGDALNSAEQAGVEVQGGNSLLDNAAAAYGGQLQNNASQVSSEAADLYLQTAAALAANENGLTDQVNAALNNAAEQNNINGLNQLAAEADNAAAIGNAVAANLPENIPTNQEDALTEAVLAIGNLPPNQVNDAVAAVENTAAVLPDNVSNAANNAAAGAGIDLQAAANNANALAGLAGINLQSNLDSANNAANNAADSAQSAVNDAIENAQVAAGNALISGNLRGPQ